MYASLAGLSVGDGFGQCFFDPVTRANCLRSRTPPPAPWYWTDDTNMARSIVSVLTELGTIDQDALARSFGHFYDGGRGYGRAMHTLLPEYERGADWRKEASQLFGGLGSYGNGASMRVAPLGAYFAGDLERVVVEARKSAEVTHTHPEGIAGGIAVAVAAALAADRTASPTSLVGSVIEHIPESEVRQSLRLIEQVSPDWALPQVVALLGNGSRITAQDTVAFTVWAAVQHLDDYPTALWLTAGALGDVDTTCAIVGGVVAARVGMEGIPAEWLARREPLPN